jgi:hypothetical protein
VFSRELFAVTLKVGFIGIPKNSGIKPKSAITAEAIKALLVDAGKTPLEPFQLFYCQWRIARVK